MNAWVRYFNSELLGDGARVTHYTRVISISPAGQDQTWYLTASDGCCYVAELVWNTHTKSFDVVVFSRDRKASPRAADFTHIRGVRCVESTAAKESE